MEFYEKIFRNVDETPEPQTGTLTKKLPDWTKGTFYSITPGVWSFQDFGVVHFYDGYGVVLRAEISENSVKLEVKHVKSDAYKKAVKAQKTVLTEFGTPSSNDDSKGFFSKLTTFIPEYSDNSNTQVYTIGNEVFISNAYCFFRHLNQEKFGTGEKFDCRDVFGMEALNAPPILDSDGTYYCVCTGLTITGSTYGIFKLPPVASPGDLECVKRSFANCEKLTVFATPRLMTATYIRSVGFTKNYVILIEQPYRLSLKRLMGKIITGAHHAFSEVTHFHPDFLNQFIIVEKSTGNKYPVTIQSSEQFFLFDVINSYETTDENGQTKIAIDINCYPNEKCMVEYLSMGNCRTGTKPRIDEVPSIKRFLLPLTPEFSNAKQQNDQAVTVIPEVLSGPAMEFPTINKDHRGKPYRYYYGTGFIFHSQYEKSLVKIDIETKEEKRWKHGHNYVVPNGAAFVPRPGAVEEDDGILISMVTDARGEGQCFLLFLCAKTMEEISRVEFTSTFIPFLTSSIFTPAN